MLLPSGNPFKCHEEVLYFQLLIPPKRFDIFFPLTGGCSEGLGAFRFFFKNTYVPVLLYVQARACMHIYQSTDQLRKIAKPARGQPNRENEYFTVSVRA